MVIQRQIILLRSGGLHQQWAHQHRYGPQTRWWKGPHQRPQNGPQAAFSMGVKFWTAPPKEAAPRVV
jgi:hypothetical protein